MVQFWKAVWEFLEKVNTLLTYNPIIPLLGIFPRETKTCSFKDLCTNVFNGFIHNCPKLERHKWPSTSKRININMMEYYPVVTKQINYDTGKTTRVSLGWVKEVSLKDYIWFHLFAENRHVIARDKNWGGSDHEGRFLKPWYYFVS